MTLIKKSDVMNHRLSMKTGVSVFPFGLKRCDPAPNPKDKASGEKIETGLNPSPRPRSC
jgi:hypothetical protein